MRQERILIIKHGALGDIILATGPMKAIRNRHPNAHIVLMTTKSFAPLFKPCPFVDEIWIDAKPKAWQFGKLVELIKAFNQPRFDWVYDLQTSGRSTRYFKLFLKPKPSCSGLAKDASHRHHTPERTKLHTIDRQKQQLAIAGITDVPPPDISWMIDDSKIDDRIESGNRPLVLLVPGGSAHRPEKRWPAEYYAELATRLIAQGYDIALIGAGAEAELLSTIESSIGGPSVINLCNRTNFGQIAALARHAAYAVGNDTGPMHIIAAAGGACSVIFNITASNPALCAPRGEKASILTTENMDLLQVDEVLKGVMK